MTTYLEIWCWVSL